MNEALHGAAERPNRDHVQALVVDDYAGVRVAVRALLRRLGFEVTEACNGLEGLAALEDGVFDLAVVDWNMPVLSGIMFVETLRADPRCDRMKVVMLTSKCDGADVAGIAGVDAYLAKPLKGDELRAELTALGFAVR